MGRLPVGRLRVCARWALGDGGGWAAGRLRDSVRGFRQNTSRVTVWYGCVRIMGKDMVMGRLEEVGMTYF